MSQYFVFSVQSPVFNSINISRIMNSALLRKFEFLDQTDWSVFSSNNNIFVINNLTNDHYLLDRTEKYSNYAFNALKRRATYKMPNTPHIILANERPSQIYLQVLVQNTPYELEKLISKNLCVNNIRQLLKKVTKIAQSLVKKYGFFTITQKMVRVTNNLNVVLWVHQNYIKMFPQFPINFSNLCEGYKNTIDCIISIFEKAGCKNTLGNLRKKVEQDNLLNFDKFRLYIDSNIRCSYRQKRIIKKNSLPPQFLMRRHSQFTSRFKTQYLDSQKFQIQNMVCRESQHSLTRVSYEDSRISPITLTNQNPQRNKFIQQRNSFELKDRLKIKTGNKKQSESPQKCNSKDFSNSLKTTGLFSSIQSSGKISQKYDEKVKKTSDAISDKRVGKSILPGSIMQDRNQQITTPKNVFMDQQMNRVTGFSDFETEFQKFLVGDQARENEYLSSFHELQNQFNDILYKN